MAKNAQGYTQKRTQLLPLCEVNECKFTTFSRGEQKKQPHNEHFGDFEGDKTKVCRVEVTKSLLFPPRTYALSVGTEESIVNLLLLTGKLRNLTFKASVSLMNRHFGMNFENQAHL